MKLQFIKYIMDYNLNIGYNNNNSNIQSNS